VTKICYNIVLVRRIIVIETFITAFRAGHSGCRGTCDCGREFFNPDVFVWDFDEGEIDALREDDSTVELNYAVQYIKFMNREYVIDCNCWRAKGTEVMNFIDHHGPQIAKYLNTERERKIHEAEQVEIIKILSDDGLKKPEFDDDIPF